MTRRPDAGIVPVTCDHDLVGRRPATYGLRPAWAWFLVLVRMYLGGQMLFYGVAKVIPTQKPEPPLAASGLWALAGCVPAGWQSWHSHAIWSVTEFIAEGRPPTPLTTDEIHWQRIIFDERC